MDKLFDGSDAHLLPGNAALIERLRHNPAIELFAEAADALEAADKRIAKLESGWAACHAQLDESCDERYKLERKLDVARESMRNTYAMLLGEPHTALACMQAEDMLRGALAQIGGDDAGS